MASSDCDFVLLNLSQSRLVSESLSWIACCNAFGVSHSLYGKKRLVKILNNNNNNDIRHLL
jgi:hypothetical protein